MARAKTLLADVVAASREVADTSSRSAKVAILAELLTGSSRRGPIAVGFLSGVPRQGRVGVGYSTIYGIEHAAAPSRRSPSTSSTARSPRSRPRPAAGRRRSATQILGELLGAPPRTRRTSSGGSSPASCARGARRRDGRRDRAKAAGVSGEPRAAR